jgi:hypothetical protein
VSLALYRPRVRPSQVVGGIITVFIDSQLVQRTIFAFSRHAQSIGDYLGYEIDTKKYQS